MVTVCQIRHSNRLPESVASVAKHKQEIVLEHVYLDDRDLCFFVCFLCIFVSICLFILSIKNTPT